MHFSYICPIDRALPGATTPGQKGTGSDGNKVMFRIFDAPTSVQLHHLIVFIVISRTLVGQFYPSGEV